MTILRVSVIAEHYDKAGLLIGISNKSTSSFGFVDNYPPESLEKIAKSLKGSADITAKNMGIIALEPEQRT